MFGVLSGCSDSSSTDDVDESDSNAENTTPVESTPTPPNQEPIQNASFTLEQLVGRWLSPCFFRPELETGNTFVELDYVQFEFEYDREFARITQRNYSDENCTSDNTGSVGTGSGDPFGDFVTTEEGLQALVFFDNVVFFNVTNETIIDGTTSIDGTTRDEVFVDINHLSNGQLFFGDLSTKTGPSDPPTRLDLDNPWTFLGPPEG